MSPDEVPGPCLARRPRNRLPHTRPIRSGGLIRSEGLFVPVFPASLHTDPRHAAFVERAAPREVLGLTLPVAALEDVLKGKVWAVEDSTRRPSKRQKDLADIARLLEAYPDSRDEVPADVLGRLL